jgi:leucyl/phenylalanyl-tRNA--protein transferase
VIDIPENFILKNDNTPFPDVAKALLEPNGLVAVGGRLTSERLIKAYSLGIFPWFNEDEPTLWYSPNPRMILNHRLFHTSKNLHKLINSNKFEVRVNTNFNEVINYCKNIHRKDQNGTWINSEMVLAYKELNRIGICQSIETYENNQLIGGLYGISMGKVFFGESMFSIKNNASKVALEFLVNQMDFELIDCQVENEHLKSLGAQNIPREVFINLLSELL